MSKAGQSLCEDTIFGKITRGEVPCDYVFQDEKCVVIHDIQPMAPVHLLVLSRKPIRTIADAEDDDADLLGHLLIVARRVASEQNLINGFRVVINTGPDGSNAIPHLHIHVLGARPMGWPPG